MESPRRRSRRAPGSTLPCVLSRGNHERAGSSRQRGLEAPDRASGRASRSGSSSARRARGRRRAPSPSSRARRSWRSSCAPPRAGSRGRARPRAARRPDRSTSSSTVSRCSRARRSTPAGSPWAPPTTSCSPPSATSRPSSRRGQRPAVPPDPDAADHLQARVPQLIGTGRKHGFGYTPKPSSSTTPRAPASYLRLRSDATRDSNLLAVRSRRGRGVRPDGILPGPQRMRFLLRLTALTLSSPGPR